MNLAARLPNLLRESVWSAAPATPVRSPSEGREETTTKDPLGPALGHFAKGNWAAAFHELKRMADAGHPQAARIALMMNAHGPRLFGGSFLITPVQRRCWRTSADE